MGEFLLGFQSFQSFIEVGEAGLQYAQVAGRGIGRKLFQYSAA